MLEGQLGSLHKSAQFPSWRHNSQLKWVFFPPVLIYGVGEKELQCMCWRGQVKPSVSSWWQKVILAEHLVMSAIWLVSVSYFSLFFILPSCSSQASLCLVILTLETQGTFGMVLHPWSNPCISLSHYLPVGTFLLTAKWFDIFLLSLSQGLCRGLHLRSMFFSPPSFFWLGDLAFVTSCITKSYSGCSFCVGDLGFNGLVSGVVLNALIRRWPGDGASLTETQGGNWSFIWVQEVHAEEWRLWSQYPICTAQSHLNMFCFMWTAMPFHFVFLFQGTITWSLCCRAGGLAHTFFQLGIERAPASSLIVLQK